MSEAVKQWYLVYAKPRAEAVAQTNLERQGYATYLPLIRQPRRRAGRRVFAIGPMFPRYLFIRLDRATDNWGPIRSTLGVVSVVRFGGVAAPVPDGLIEALKRREDDQGLHVVPVDSYHPGARVRIIEGGLMGYEGVFLARSGHDRIAVLLELMGRTARTVVDAGAVEPSR